MARTQPVLQASWFSLPPEPASQLHLHPASSLRPLAPAHLMRFQGSPRLQVEIAPSQSRDTPQAPIPLVFRLLVPGRHHLYSAPLSAGTAPQLLLPSSLITHPSCPGSLSLQS